MLKNKLIKVLFLLGVTLMFISPNSYANTPLTFEIYNPGTKSIFPVTSVIVEGPNETALIDAQFQKDDAENLVNRIKSKNKKLAFVYISHYDPDYYFGLDVIKQAFPDVRVYTTQRTFDAIRNSMNDKLSYWGPILKENAPSKLVMPEVLLGNKLTLDSVDMEIKEISNQNTYVWVPSEKTVLGGAILYDNMHVWLADAKSQTERQERIKALEDMSALEPSNVIPGHFVGEYKPSTEAIEFVKNYIETFDQEAQTAEDSKELIAKMKEKYSTLYGDDILDMSAKVVKNEMEWPIVSMFPGEGKTLEINFGETVFHLSFHDEKNLSFVAIKGANKGLTDTAEYTKIQIRPYIYIVYWIEKTTKIKVVHIEDYDRGIVYSNIYNPDGTDLHLIGTMKVLGDL